MKPSTAPKQKTHKNHAQNKGQVRNSSRQCQPVEKGKRGAMSSAFALSTSSSRHKVKVEDQPSSLLVLCPNSSSLPSSPHFLFQVPCLHFPVPSFSQFAAPSSLPPSFLLFCTGRGAVCAEYAQVTSVQERERYEPSSDTKPRNPKHNQPTKTHETRTPNPQCMVDSRVQQFQVYGHL